MRQFNTNGVRGTLPVKSPSGFIKKGKKVMVISTDGKEEVGTVVFERKANYKEPFFAQQKVMS